MNAYEKRRRKNEKYEMCTPENIAGWRDEMTSLYSHLVTIHADKTPDSPLPRFARNVRTNFQTFCAYNQFIIVDALDKKDYPNNIAENSVRIIFEVDLIDKTFKVDRCGHVYLNAQESRATNLAMASMKNIVLANGGKWCRTTKFKDAKDFAKKVTKLWEDAMAIINDQTEGYPYKQLRDDANPVYQLKTKSA